MFSSSSYVFCYEDKEQKKVGDSKDAEEAERGKEQMEERHTVHVGMTWGAYIA
jgi:hypothetical protein